ncbi:MAG TPA: hypothetical protein VFT45_22165 [Longimicrobium sp.]|nr:hypothetical protein [Longimicrobium sp.]
MDRLTGIAENVRHTVHVSAGGSRTDHLALFEIGGVRLRFRGREPVAIKEGDDLAVVWEPGDKGFQTVLAFHNRTVDARDHDVRPLGCGCGCSIPLIVLLIVFAVWAAVDRRDWLYVAGALAAAVVVLVVHHSARRSDQEFAEKLRQVNDLLDSEPRASIQNVD